MIFCFLPTIEELTVTDRGELEDVFTRLVDADRCGRHFFVTARSVCQWGAEHLQLSRHDREHLRRIEEEYAVRHSMVDSSRVYANVTIGSSVVVVEVNGVFSIGHRRLLEGEYLSRETAFVVEDIVVDGQIYRLLLSEAKKLVNVPGCEFEFIHGGGSRTPRVFEAQIQRGRVVVCVADHDKLAPTDQCSSSAAEVVRVCQVRNVKQDGEEEAFIGIGLTTVGREAENYVPYHLIRTLEEYRLYRHYANLDNIVEREGAGKFQEEFWMYFDVKNGVRGADLSDKLQRGAISRDVVSWITQKLRCEMGDLEGINIDGFGKKVIEALVNSPEAMKGFHKFVRTEQWQESYRDYFEGILWFLAAPKQVRT